MRTSEKGIELIKKFEGCRLYAYYCPAGVLTIGYGHTKGVYKGMRISEKKAEELLKSDLIKYESIVNKIPGLNQNQFDALVSFTFNCGSANLNKLIKGRNLDQIGKAMLLYNKANGKVLNGLVRRRKEENKLYFTPCNVVEQMEMIPNLHGYEGTSLVDGLKSFGYEYSYTYRKSIASMVGIQGYRGTAEQNIKMLEILKNR